jgi:hypothetical protein
LTNSEETIVGMFGWASSTLLLVRRRWISREELPTLLHFLKIKLRKSMSQVLNNASLLEIWAIVTGVKWRCGNSLSSRLLFVLCENSLAVFLFLFNYRSVRNLKLVLAILLLDCHLIWSLTLRQLILVRLFADLHWIRFVEAT